MPERRPRVTTAAVALAVSGALGVVVSCGGSSRQEEVAERGREVMPFDLDATTHTFETARNGGTQTVTSDRDDRDQIALVRSHLRAEAEAFRAGDFDDPAAIHGDEMPGIGEMVEGTRSGEVDIAYAEVAGGARLTYTSDDPALVAAIHAWFDAQVSDHGAHARGG